MLLNCSVGEESWESLGLQGVQPVHPEWSRSWIFIGRTDAEAETPILWPPDAKNLLIGKDPDAGKDWRWEEKRTKEDEMVGWHHQLDGYEYEKAPGVGDGQVSLACCSPLGHKELDMTEGLTWTQLSEFPFPREDNWHSESLNKEIIQMYMVSKQQRRNYAYRSFGSTVMILIYILYFLHIPDTSQNFSNCAWCHLYQAHLEVHAKAQFLQSFTHFPN